MKLLLIAGARPNFMKIAPLVAAIGRHNSNLKETTDPIKYALVHTGQHYDAKMSDVFFQELGIPAPDINLEVGSGSHAVQTANIMVKFEPICEAEKPDWLVVVGDVNSTMACTLVASKLGVKVAHIEAGLRSFDRTMPEEINRLVTDAIADLLLTPSADADENLKREGVPIEKIRQVGNIMIDALIANLGQAQQSGILARLGIKRKNFIYVTLHRPSNVDSPDSLRKILELLGKIAQQIPIVFPMHPRTRKMIAQIEIPALNHPDFNVLEPIGYHDSLCLTQNARIVLTDSGGLQEESTFFRTPCLTLRPNTERPITVTVGSNRLSTIESLWKNLDETLRGEPLLGQIPPLWDGKTADRILACLSDTISS